MFMLIWLFFSFCYAQEGKVVVYPVAPNCHSLNGESGKENLTLDEALRNITSNTELYLLPGCHYVEEYNLVQNRSNISLIGAIQNNITITCSKGLGLAFLNVFGLTITNVTIQSCGLNGSDLLAFRNAVRSDIDFFFDFKNDYRIALLCGNCRDLTMSSSTVTNTTGLGMLAINAMGTASITDVEFSFNYLQQCTYTNISALDKVAGGAMFVYLDYLHTPERPDDVILNIQDSVVLTNSYCGLAIIPEFYSDYSEGKPVNYSLGAGGGLSIVMTQLDYAVSATVESCYFRNNSARFGGGASVQLYEGVDCSTVNFFNCSFERNGIDEAVIIRLDNPDNVVKYDFTGSGLAVLNDFARPESPEPARFSACKEPNRLSISDSIFEANRAISSGAIIIHSLYSSRFGGSHLKVLFDNCIFRRNSALLGGAMFVQELKNTGAQPGLEVIMKDINVTENEVFIPAEVSIAPPTKASAVVDIVAVNITITGNSVFSNSEGSAIRCASSLLYLEGNVTFENNAGLTGGALQLITASLLIIRENAHVIFRNNSGAISGGAIYVDYLVSLPQVSFAYADCFLFYDDLDILCITNQFCPNISDSNFRLEFVDNAAPYGSLVYGSTLETCLWGIDLKREYDTNISLFEVIYDHLGDKFHFDSAPNNTGAVSTPVGKVVIAELNNGSYSLLPGERFNISVVGLDHFERVVPVILTSRTSNANTSQSVLGLSGYWLATGNGDTNTPIAVYGRTEQQGINVTLFTADTFAQTQITVNLLKCTPGFVYSSNSCVCDERLVRQGKVECSESKKDFTVHNDIWIGPGPDKELVIHDCLQDFCIIGQKVVKSPDFDSQCRPGFHRTGLLCGKCEDGYSIIFGGNECYRCKNGSLSWIIYFALAGVGIVLAISFVQLTVSDGYLNGIILYANIVSLYVHILATGSSATHLFVVIAWLNLDLGIDTCFYDGMDSLARAGLRFVFPLYLYVLMGVIMLIAKKSHWFTMRFNKSGFSAAKLFATLMLMSYTSLLETCAVVLGAAEIQTISGKSSIRWGVDPTQKYFSGGHIPLAIVAVLVLVFYIIPAPFVLIFPSLAFKLGPLQRLKPIYDAFWAPFKPRYRFWVGLRLILRVIPFFFVGLIPHPLNVFLLALFLIVLLYIQSIAWPFEGNVKNAFDIFFICNLLVTVVGSLYFTIDNFEGEDISRHDAQYIFICVIVSIAYAVIAVIFVWHVFLRFPSLKNIRKRFRSRSYEELSASTENYGTTGEVNADVIADSNDSDNAEGVKKVYFSELREPLLEDEGSLAISTTTLTI